jgi:hypothetical protein
LAHINLLFLSEFPIQVCTLDVDLMNFKVIMGSEGEDGANGREFCNRGKCVKVVNTGDLGETLDYESGLVSDNVASGIMFCSKYPL